MLFVLLITFFFLLFIGTPIVFSVALSSLIAIWFEGIPLTLIVSRMFSSVDSFSLLAIPFYMLTGELMNKAGATKKLVKLATATTGFMRAGLAQVNIAASVFFAGISGSATADCAAIGTLLIPAMKEEGYDADFSAVVTATSSTIGPIIPPSVTMVVYGSLTGLSIGTLFLSGFLPGLFIAFGLMVTVYILSLSPSFPVKKSHIQFSFSYALQTLKEALLPLITPVIIIVGIIGGVFTATEAGTVAVIYSVIIGVFVYKSIDLKNFIEALINSAVVSCQVLLLISVSGLFGYILAINDFPEFMVYLLTIFSDSTFATTIMAMLIFLFLGMFIEGMSIIVIFAPFLAPIAHSLGFDPYHFAIFSLVGVYIGSITPPVGVLTLLSCGIAEIRFVESFKVLGKFLVGMIMIWIIIAFIPSITTILPNLLGR